jgi:hypothetical protein
MECERFIKMIQGIEFVIYTFRFNHKGTLAIEHSTTYYDIEEAIAHFNKIVAHKEQELITLSAIVDLYEKQNIHLLASWTK